MHEVTTAVVYSQATLLRDSTNEGLITGLLMES